MSVWQKQALVAHMFLSIFEENSENCIFGKLCRIILSSRIWCASKQVTSLLKGLKTHVDTRPIFFTNTVIIYLASLQ